jgi:hypothetical protein
LDGRERPEAKQQSEKSRLEGRWWKQRVEKRERGALGMGLIKR